MTGFWSFSFFLKLEQSTVFLSSHPARRPQSWAMLFGANVLAAPVYYRLKQVFNHPRQRGDMLFQTRSRLWNGRLIRNKNRRAPIKWTVLWQTPRVLEHSCLTKVYRTNKRASGVLMEKEVKAWLTIAFSVRLLLIYCHLGLFKVSPPPPLAPLFSAEIITEECLGHH